MNGLVLFLGGFSRYLYWYGFFGGQRVGLLRSRSGIRETRVAGAERSGCGSVWRISSTMSRSARGGELGEGATGSVVTGNARPGY